MSNEDKRHIKTVDKDGKELILYLSPPDYEITRMCDIEHKKAWAFCLKEGVKTHAALVQMYKDNGTWTEEHDAKLQSVNIELAINSVVLENLKRSKSKKDIDKANDVALKILQLRNQAAALSELKSQPYLYSCEHAADQIRMEAYLAYATVYEDDRKKRYFTSYQDFTEKRQEQAALDIYSVYLQMITEENSEYIKNLPENQYLVSSGMLDDNLRAKKKKSSVKEPKKKTTAAQKTKKKKGAAVKKKVTKKAKKNKD